MVVIALPTAAIVRTSNKKKNHKRIKAGIRRAQRVKVPARNVKETEKVTQMIANRTSKEIFKNYYNETHTRILSLPDTGNAIVI